MQPVRLKSIIRREGDTWIYTSVVAVDRFTFEVKIARDRTDDPPAGSASLLGDPHQTPWADLSNLTITLLTASNSSTDHPPIDEFRTAEAILLRRATRRLLDAE